jgi:hypothetical protein
MVAERLMQGHNRGVRKIRNEHTTPDRGLPSSGPRRAKLLTQRFTGIFGGRGRTRTGTPVSQKQILSLLCLPFHHAA